MSEADCDWSVPRFEGLDDVLAGADGFGGGARAEMGSFFFFFFFF